VVANYLSQAKAARAHPGLLQSKISQAIRSKKVYGGFRWRKAPADVSLFPAGIGGRGMFCPIEQVTPYLGHS